jgi:hypothetical protein
LFSLSFSQKGRGKENSKEKKGCEFYLWEDDYEQYLKDNHGYKSEIGEGGATVVGGPIGGGTQQETMHTIAIEDEETGLLGNAVNKRYDQEICILLKALVAVGVVGLVVMICILVVIMK